MRILIFSPHPDDAEYSLGGVIARAASLNWEVEVVYLTGGEMGGTLKTADVTGKIRRTEAAAAAAILSYRHLFLPFRDLELDDRPETVLAAARRIREFRPRVVLVNHPDDEHPDHRAAAAVVEQACFYAVLPAVDRGGPEPYQVPQLFYYEAFSSRNFQPWFLLDVSPYFETAVKAVTAHACGTGGVPFLLEKMTACHLFRGVQGGVRYAEGIIPGRGRWFDAVANRAQGLEFVCRLNGFDSGRLYGKDGARCVDSGRAG
ncbi:PIG-L deacetylase family protein [Desulfotomaculum copahuensis]|uniref:GlcNAc-PI de-N-acetylase n=1 Tax=Desulfotomaculum copahuensis TaxID=1838280 RepID=A0A1B7LFX2_9FIRM|nr:PIG-L family deacetylase [Desulfotomaculum copahuensis]OAT83618.1 hypothetical protein A6M21_08010 [Desulfotomaculum copahuensis]